MRYISIKFDHSIGRYLSYVQFFEFTEVQISSIKDALQNSTDDVEKLKLYQTIIDKWNAEELPNRMYYLVN